MSTTRPGATNGPQRTVDVKDLPLPSQAAHEILKHLRDVDAKGRARVLEVAAQQEPVSQNGLAAVAAVFHRLEMPLTNAGIQRFKAERGLGGGTTINQATAKAYARAVNGGEVLFRIDRSEESSLRPADKACLAFLRTWSRSHGAEAVGRLKEALGLGNLPVGPDAASLANEYVGLNTVREVSHASSMRNCALTPEGMNDLVTQLENEAAGRQQGQEILSRTDATAKAPPTPPPPPPSTPREPSRSRLGPVTAMSRNRK